MGIQDLGKIIKDAKERVSLDDIEGFRVAVDIPVYLYQFVRSSENWTDRLINFVRCLRKRCIKPVFVFDGPNAPIQKKEESVRRRLLENKQKEKYEKIQALSKNMISEDNHGSIISTLKELFPKTKIPTEKPLLKKFMMDKTQSMKLQTKVIDTEIMNAAKEILGILGMAIIQADGEAETLCVNLCYSGKVDAIFTEDTDVLAYKGGEGCNLIMLSGLDLLSSTLSFISKEQLVKELGITEESFRDMCILLSCDYNTRIRDFGPAHVYEYVQAHTNIETMIDEEVILPEDLEKTKYEICREIFTCRNVDIRVPMNQPIDTSELESYLKRTKSISTLDDILEDWIVNYL